jgi:CRISPR-associated exonuclease Cas4
LELIWDENRLTAEGRVLHEKADSGVPGRLPGVRIERSLPLRSFRLGLSGYADVVEFRRNEGGTDRPFPVEYKRGRPRRSDLADHIQVCAQAICLEEMFQAEIPAGALYYGGQHRRVEVIFTEELRQLTADTAAAVHTLFASGITPAPRLAKSCQSCSLARECLGRTVSRPVSASEYLQDLLKADQT